MKITYENILRAELSKKNGSIKLKGKSIIEASADFYKNIIEWLDLYVSQPNDQTRVDIYLEYYNTISSKYLLFYFYQVWNIYIKVVTVMFSSNGIMKAMMRI